MSSLTPIRGIDSSHSRERGAPEFEFALPQRSVGENAQGHVPSRQRLSHRIILPATCIIETKELQDGVGSHREVWEET